MTNKTVSEGYNSEETKLCAHRVAQRPEVLVVGRLRTDDSLKLESKLVASVTGLLVASPPSRAVARSWSSASKS